MGTSWCIMERTSLIVLNAGLTIIYIIGLIENATLNKASNKAMLAPSNRGNKCTLTVYLTEIKIPSHVVERDKDGKRQYRDSKIYPLL